MSRAEKRAVAAVWDERHLTRMEVSKFHRPLSIETVPQSAIRVNFSARSDRLHSLQPIYWFISVQLQVVSRKCPRDLVRDQDQDHLAVEVAVLPALDPQALPHHVLLLIDR